MGAARDRKRRPKGNRCAGGKARPGTLSVLRRSIFGACVRRLTSLCRECRVAATTVHRAPRTRPQRERLRTVGRAFRYVTAWSCGLRRVAPKPTNASGVHQAPGARAALSRFRMIHCLVEMPGHSTRHQNELSAASLLGIAALCVFAAAFAPLAVELSIARPPIEACSSPEARMQPMSDHAQCVIAQR